MFELKVTSNRQAMGAEFVARPTAMAGHRLPGGTGLWPVVSGVAPETGATDGQRPPPTQTESGHCLTKSGATPDLTGATSVPPPFPPNHFIA
jgi:hypothetical protein